MSNLYNYLMDKHSKEELAKMVAKLAHENAALKNEKYLLGYELFWMKSKERNENGY